METIYGYLERITFVNEENHFTVARLQEKAKKELTTMVGNLAGINPGESLRLLESGSTTQNTEINFRWRSMKQLFPLL